MPSYWVRVMAVRCVLYVGEGEEDEEAVKLVRERFGGKEVMVIRVSRDGVRGWLRWEYGTDETPLLATPFGVYYGLKAIKTVASQLAPRIS